MKKFFTLLGGLLLASSLSVKAEEVTVMITDYNYNPIADSYKAELTKDADGNWTLADFLQSEMPISFKFDKPAANGSSMLTITSPTFAFEGSEDMPYICDAEDNYPTGYLYNYNNNNTWVSIQWPYLYLHDDYFTVYGYDMTDENNTYEYYARIALTGDFSTYDEATGEYVAFGDGNNPWIYVGFYFNEPEATEEPGEESGDKAEVNEEVTVYISDYDGNSVADSYEAVLTQDANGNYVLSDFLNSGAPLAISFDKPEVGEYTDISFPELGVRDGSAYVKTPDGAYAKCYLFNGDDVTKLSFTLVYADGYSYVDRYDKSENGYEYCATICALGYTDNWLDDYTYVSFWFNLPEDNEGEEPGDEPNDEPYVFKDQEITVEILDYDDNEVAESCATTLTKNEAGNYVIGDFVNSGTALAFNFEQPEIGEYSVLTFPELTDEGGYVYVKTPADKYATCYLFGYNGEEMYKVTYPYIWTGEYATVYRYDETSYYVTITLGGCDSDGEYMDDDVYPSFWFYLTEASEGAAVISAEAVENAPVEYYNLNGQRVSNPSNGIFIRKQGSKTTKVAIK